MTLWAHQWLEYYRLMSCCSPLINSLLRLVEYFRVCARETFLFLLAEHSKTFDSLTEHYRGDTLFMLGRNRILFLGGLVIRKSTTKSSAASSSFYDVPSKDFKVPYRNKAKYSHYNNYHQVIMMLWPDECLTGRRGCFCILNIPSRCQ